jgi:hypothetical protein
MPTAKLLENVNRPLRYYQKKSILRAPSEGELTTNTTKLEPFRENLFSFAHKNNISYPEELVSLYA